MGRLTSNWDDLPGMLSRRDPNMSSLFSSVFLWTLLFIFLSAIVGAIISQRRRDRCLRMLDDYHVTLAMDSGRVIWGDLRVFPNGLRLQYDAAYRTAGGLIKSGYLLYGPEMGKLLAICRYVGNLTNDERVKRHRQVMRRFKPGSLRRLWRSIRNLFSTVRDAFNQALSAFIGQVAKTSGSKVVATQKGEMEKLGKSLLGVVGKAYEPMLEQLIGKPIVLELASPNDPDTENIEIAGYLAEYSDKYLAIFSITHDAVESFELAVPDQRPDEPEASTEEPADEQAAGEEAADGAATTDGQSTDATPDDNRGVHITVAEYELVVENRREVPLIIDELCSDTGKTRTLGIVLTNAASARLPRIEGALTIRCSRVQEIDLVCPRAHAVVRYASLDEIPENESDRLPPAHEDRKVWFP